MNKCVVKWWKKLLCYICAVSLCLQYVTDVTAEEGKIWSRADLNGVKFREIADNGWMVCGYDPSANQEGTLAIASSYSVRSDSEETWYYVKGIEDEVFATREDGENHSFSLLHINALEGMTIGQSAFKGVVVQGDSSADYTAKITGNKLAEIGDHAFEGAQINGDLSIAGIKGSIGKGAFSNAVIKGNFTINGMDQCTIDSGAFQQIQLEKQLILKGSIDTLGDYALANLSAQRFNLLNNIIYHMGDRVFYNTPMTGATYPLSNYLQTIGSQI